MNWEAIIGLTLFAGFMFALLRFFKWVAHGNEKIQRYGAVPLHVSHEVFRARFREQVYANRSGYTGFMRNDECFLLRFLPDNTFRRGIIFWVTLRGRLREDRVDYRIRGWQSYRSPSYELERLLKKLAELCAPQNNINDQGEHK